MTVWEFRACVRAYRECLGRRCPLGVALKVLGGDRAPSFPLRPIASKGLGLDRAYVDGVVDGFDGLGRLGDARGYRYGQRLRRVTP